MDTISPHMLALAPGQIQVFAGAAGGRRSPPLRRLMQAASRWRWVLIGGIALGALAGILITPLMTRQYSSTVRLEIARETARVVDIGGVERDTSIGDQEFYQTQYGLLHTKALSERVVRELDLQDNPTVIKMFGREDLLKAGQNNILSSAKRDNRIETLGKVLLAHLAMSPVRVSHLVD